MVQVAFNTIWPGNCSLGAVLELRWITGGGNIVMQYPDAGEWILLFMLEVLVEVDECVKEDRSQRTRLQVLKADSTVFLWLHHIQHLQTTASTIHVLSLTTVPR